MENREKSRKSEREKSPRKRGEAFWIVLDRFGSFRIVLDRFGSFWIVLDKDIDIIKCLFSLVGIFNI